MSNTYRYVLLWVSVAALVGSALLATTPAASRAQLTWQGSYLTTPRPVLGYRLIQGHSAAPEVLLVPEREGIFWQLALGVFLILVGFGFHALFLSSHARAAPVRVRSVPRGDRAHERQAVLYWYEWRL